MAFAQVGKTIDKIDGQRWQFCVSAFQKLAL
jgi:hypothetical protein